MNELIFEVVQEEDGGFVAECLTESIFTQADTWDALRENVREATVAFFFDQLSVPDHKSLRIGTLNNILRAVVRHKDVRRDAILASLT